MPETSAADERITQLEVKLAYAEDWLDTLNATVARQQEQIELLAREVVRLRRRQADDDPASWTGPTDERPPHY